MRAFIYLRPRSIAEASAMAASAKAPAHFLAGGTCLIDLMKQGVEQPASVIDLNFASELAAIGVLADGTLRVGGAATLAHVARDARVEKGWPLLHETILDGLTPQLRNAATFAGNISQRPRCHYFREQGFNCEKKQPGTGCAARSGVHYAHAIFGIDTESGCIAVHPSDLAVALTAYDATVQLMASDGNRRAMPIRDFLKPAEADPTSETEAAPGELITAIDIPPQGGRSGDYVKMPAEGFAMASAATLMALRDGYVESVSIALGGVAHRPWRSSEAEAFMIGKEPSVKTFDLVATAFVNEAVTDEQTAFRRPLLKQVIMQSLDRAAAYWSRS